MIDRTQRMTRPRRLALAMAALLAAWLPQALAHDIVPGAKQDRPIMLKGGDLFTISHGVLANTDLLFEDGTIVAIGQNLNPPQGTEVIDVSGHRVYPGLIAAQSSLGLVEIGAVRATRDTSEIGNFTPEASSHVAYNPDSELIPTVRSHGITTAQIVPSGSGVRGRTSILHLDGWNKEDAGVALDEGLQVSWPSRGRARRNETDKQRKERFERFEKARKEFVGHMQRAHNYARARQADASMPIDIRLEAMRPALSGEATFYVQADSYGAISDAIATTQRMGLKMVLVGGRDAHLLTDQLKEYDIPVILGSVNTLPSRQDDDYDLAYRRPALLADAGVRFCIAQRSGASWSLRNLPLDVGHAVAHGLDRSEALRSMTLSAAEILGVDDQLGSLEEGKSATFFVSESDVMDVLTQNVTHMFIEGRRVDVNNRHRQLYRKYDER